MGCGPCSGPSRPQGSALPPPHHLPGSSHAQVRSGGGISPGQQCSEKAVFCGDTSCRRAGIAQRPGPQTGASARAEMQKYTLSSLFFFSGRVITLSGVRGKDTGSPAEDFSGTG